MLVLNLMTLLGIVLVTLIQCRIIDIGNRRPFVVCRVLLLTSRVGVCGLGRCIRFSLRIARIKAFCPSTSIGYIRRNRRIHARSSSLLGKIITPNAVLVIRV